MARESRIHVVGKCELHTERDSLEMREMSGLSLENLTVVITTTKTGGKAWRLG